MNRYKLQSTLRDLDDIYSEMQSGVCSELDDIMQGINKAWDSGTKDEFMQKTGILSRLLDETAADIKKLREKMLEEYRHSMRVNERNKSDNSLL